MKLLVAATALLVVGTSAASAQYGEWRRGYHPYQQRHHNVCQEKAYRLWDFERRTHIDGRVSKDERRIVEGLRYDLDRTCGRWRHRG